MQAYRLRSFGGSLAELPASWGLKAVKRDDGKLDVVGKDDSGQDYRVRTTDHAEITETDVQELKAADRESYSNRESGVRSFIKGLEAHGNRRKDAEESNLLDELTEAAGPVVRAGFEREGSTVGSSRKYRANYDAVFGGNA